MTVEPKIPGTFIPFRVFTLPRGLIGAWRAQWPYLAPDGEEWPDEEQLVDDLSPDEKLGVIGAPQATGSTEGAEEPPGPLGLDEA
jgi:hypothetical protein